uniref:Uncharacterized protein n=1 Tax=Anguilla anguilla TaxID=7936 RepID=A0A0E9WEM6_ANGAN
MNTKYGNKPFLSSSITLKTIVSHENKNLCSHGYNDVLLVQPHPYSPDKLLPRIFLGKKALFKESF